MNNRRLHLTLIYTAFLSVVLTVSLVIIFVVSERSRHEAFQGTLRSEAITKANLFLENRVDASTMQHIYLNNTRFINEVEVAIYTPDFEMLYHDAAEHDIVKESYDIIRQIYQRGEMDIPVSSPYQAIGILYHHAGGQNGEEAYIVTAAAHDGYGESNMLALRHALLTIFLVSLLLMFVVGFYLANITIRPIEQALASQKMFVSNVSHELRTPLAAIMGELGLALQKERTPEDYQQRITRALQDTNRMSNTIIGLLNMARAEYDASEIKMESIRVDELLIDVRDELLRAKNNYHIDISFSGEIADNSDDLLTIHANRYLMSLAFRNLMENNCKYSPDHRSQVEIHLPDTMAHGDGRQTERLSVSFADNGIGMTDEEQKNIFQLFYRGTNATLLHHASSDSGHGIGMALVQRILHLHNFHIRVLSKHGHGTRFVLLFY